MADRTEGAQMTAFDRAQMCEEILKAIAAHCNKRMAEGKEGWQIAFGPDWGSHSLTVYDPELGHTHIGGFHSDAKWDELVQDLHNQLIAGRGLSWAPEVKP
jgi:hypothetical protein